MTTHRENLTSSEVLGASEGGVCWTIVPDPHTSSSYDGQIKCRASGVDDADVRRSSASTPLRLRGGGDSTEEEDERREAERSRREDPDFAVPGPSSARRKPGPGSGRSRSRSLVRKEGKVGKEETKEKEKEEEKKNKESAGIRSRDGSREHRRKVEGGSLESPIVVIEDISLTPKTSFNAMEVEKEEAMEESGMRSRRSSSASSVGTTLGTKRTREEDGDGEGSNEEESDDSHSSSSSPPMKKPNRKPDGTPENRGRKAKEPSHAGQFTAEKMAAKKKEKEDKEMEDREEWVRDRSTKATTKRALKAEKNALELMREFEEAPTVSLTQKGIDAVESIKKVAATSSNLKGPLKGKLWRAVEELTALNLAFSKRSRTDSGEEGERRATEIEDLRREIRELRSSEAILQGQMKALREAAAGGGVGMETNPPAPPPAPTKRRKSGGKKVENQISFDSNSSDEGEKMEVERDLSPASREAGRLAREEVERDKRDGTMPPVDRPPIKGKSARLEGGEIPPVLRTEVLSPPPNMSTTWMEGEEIPPVINTEVLSPLPQRPMGPRIRSVQVLAPPVIPGMGEIVRAVLTALAATGVIPSPGSIPPVGGMSRGGGDP